MMHGGALQFSDNSGAIPDAESAAARERDLFRDNRKRGGARCPHCRNIGHIRSSAEVTPLVWDVYYNCTHPGCNHSWKAQLAYSYGLSPSAVPNPEFADLEMRPMPRADVVKPDPPPENDPNQPRLFE